MWYNISYERKDFEWRKMDRLFDIFYFELKTRPRPFGAIHLFFILLTILGGIYVARFLRRRNLVSVDDTTGRIGLIYLFLEVLKQILLYFESGQLNYQWEALPFQFCSLPLYFCLVTPFIKNQKIKKHCYAFVSCYGIVGGLSVILTGGRIFEHLLWKDLHTMLWHSLMIVHGIYILVNYPLTEKKELSGAFKIFCSVVFLACVLNIGGYMYFGEPRFNLFNISPYGGCDGYPIGEWLYSSTDAAHMIATNQGWFNWLVLIATYVMVFALLAKAVLGLNTLFRKLLNIQIDKEYFFGKYQDTSDLSDNVFEEMALYEESRD